MGAPLRSIGRESAAFFSLKDRDERQVSVADDLPMRGDADRLSATLAVVVAATLLVVVPMASMSYAICAFAPAGIANSLFFAAIVRPPRRAGRRSSGWGAEYRGGLRRYGHGQGTHRRHPVAADCARRRGQCCVGRDLRVRVVATMVLSRAANACDSRKAIGGETQHVDPPPPARRRAAIAVDALSGRIAL